MNWVRNRSYPEDIEYDDNLEIIVEYNGYADEEFQRMRSNALTWEQLEKLPTPRLLTYYKKYRGWRWLGVCDCCGEILSQSDRIHNLIANDYLDGIKKLLDRREHVAA